MISLIPNVTKWGCRISARERRDFLSTKKSENRNKKFLK